MVSIARNVNHKNNEEYVVQILRFKGGIVYIEDHWCSYYLVHSPILLSKLTMDMFFLYKNGNTLLYALTT